MAPSPRISVIVPAWNEEANVAACLAAVRTEFPGELIVVDGGSTDATAMRATAAGARLVRAPRGLAAQCNAGAVAATGDVLVFVAADSRLGAGWLMALLETLRSPYVVAGGFRLKLDHPATAFRAIEWGGNFRARYCRLALPDQGLFVRRDAYEAVGGMATASLIPFARLCFELRRQGDFVLLRPQTLSSARKWLQHGRLATTLHHARTYLRFKYRELPPWG